MKTNKTKFMIVVLLLALALVMTACGSAQDAPEAGAVAEEAPMEEPANTPEAETSAEEEPAEAPSEEMPAVDYATLTDADGGLVLLENAEVSDDELDYNLTLKTGVTFEDGTLMDADAVIANFNRWSDPENEYPEWLALFEGFKGELDEEGKLKSSFDGIEKVNDFTVLVHLNRPVDNMLVGLGDPAFAVLSPDGLANGEEIGVTQ